MNQFSRIAVLGANGQIGSALTEQLGERAIALTRAEADLSNPNSLVAVLDRIQPDAVINAAAYTAVDKAEEEYDLALAANALSPAQLAAWCAKQSVPFIHYSTDYVFDGEGNAPWKESDATNPVNRYGKTKLEGEEAVAAQGGDYLIFRTSWVYDATGKNFMNTMLRLGAERETLNVVSDQIGAPSYAPDLAAYTLKALEKAASMPHFPSGVYHMVNNGETSWHGFAQQIFAGAREKGNHLAIKTVEPIASSAYPTPAKRPLNSRLDCSKLHKVFGLALPSWQQGLTTALEQKYHASNYLSA
jgi:dTDP-4-dehydrorhamnose reductase